MWKRYIIHQKYLGARLDNKGEKNWRRFIKRALMKQAFHKNQKIRQLLFFFSHSKTMVGFPKHFYLQNTSFCIDKSVISDWLSKKYTTCKSD